MFQFTPVLRRATRICKSIFAHGGSFNSRPSCDGRPRLGVRFALHDSFNSRPSCDGRPFRRVRVKVDIIVSIHARLATGDLAFPFLFAVFVWFQFTPVLRRATNSFRFSFQPIVFQFTPVLRRATGIAISTVATASFQFTPVLRRATSDMRKR